MTLTADLESQSENLVPKIDNVGVHVKTRNMHVPKLLIYINGNIISKLYGDIDLDLCKTAPKLERAYYIVVYY